MATKASLRRLVLLWEGRGKSWGGGLFSFKVSETRSLIPYPAANDPIQAPNKSFSKQQSVLIVNPGFRGYLPCPPLTFNITKNTTHFISILRGQIKGTLASVQHFSSLPSPCIMFLINITKSPSKLAYHDCSSPFNFLPAWRGKGRKDAEIIRSLEQADEIGHFLGKMSSRKTVTTTLQNAGGIRIGKRDRVRHL